MNRTKRLSPKAATESIRLDRILVEDRLRAIDPDWVAALAANIAEFGQQQPVIVRPHEAEAGRYLLVIGAHRYAAVKRLGWPEIMAEVRSLSAAEARLAEIDENLFRYELTPLDRAVFLAERKAIYEELHPETKRGVAGGRARQGEANEMISFADATAEKTGLSPRTVQRAVRICERLAPEVRRRLSGTDLARKEGELYQLTKMPPELQGRVVELVLMGAEPSVKAARAVVEGSAATPDDPEERQFQKLMDAWRRAGRPARARFLRALREDGALDGEDAAVRGEAA